VQHGKSPWKSSETRSPTLSACTTTGIDTLIVPNDPVDSLADFHCRTCPFLAYAISCSCLLCLAYTTFASLTSPDQNAVGQTDSHVLPPQTGTDITHTSISTPMRIKRGRTTIGEHSNTLHDATPIGVRKSVGWSANLAFVPLRKVVHNHDSTVQYVFPLTFSLSRPA